VVAADVVEVDVDAFGGGLPKLAENGGGLVVKAASKPISRSQPTFSSLPALPITRAAPLSLAIWPATLPTAPAAPETNTTSPGLSAAMSSRPT
jgi:hypothetical protein